jgi:hypothetical protein
MKILNTKQLKVFAANSSFNSLIVLGIFCISLLLESNTFAGGKKQIPESHFRDLPTELIYEIMNQLNAPEYFKLSGTNTGFRKIGSDKILLQKLKERDSLGWRLHWPISGKIAAVLEEMKKFKPILADFIKVNSRLIYYKIEVVTDRSLGFVVYKLIQNKGVGSMYTTTEEDSSKVVLLDRSESQDEYVNTVDQVISNELPLYLTRMISGWEQSPPQNDLDYSVCKVGPDDDIFPFFQFILARFRPQFQELERVEITKEDVFSRRPGIQKICLSGEATAIDLLFSLLERES